MLKPHTIFLVEDHIIVRNGLKELIEHIGNYKVEGEFDNGKQLTEEIANAQPDLIIMDLAMPVMDGKSTMIWMKERNMDCKVLILTLDVSDQAIIDLYKLGVRGYLPKTCTADVLKKAIEDIIYTGYFHNELLFNAIKNPKKEEHDDVTKLLSVREMDFLRLVADKEEYTYEQIAAKMTVHRRTVDGYRESLFEKLKIKSKTGLVLYAIKHGVIKV